jgi:hypothetical protein
MHCTKSQQLFGMSSLCLNTRLTVTSTWAPDEKKFSRYDVCSSRLNAINYIAANPNFCGTRFSFMPHHCTDIEGCAQSCVAPIQTYVDWNMFVPCCNPCTGCTWSGYNSFSRTVRHATLWERRPVAGEMWRVLVDWLPCTIPNTSFSSRTLRLPRPAGACVKRVPVSLRLRCTLRSTRR